MVLKGRVWPEQQRHALCGGCTSTQVPPLGLLSPKQPQAVACAGAAVQGGKTEAPHGGVWGGRGGLQRPASGGRQGMQWESAPDGEGSWATGGTCRLPRACTCLWQLALVARPPLAEPHLRDWGSAGTSGHDGSTAPQEVPLQALPLRPDAHYCGRLGLAGAGWGGDGGPSAETPLGRESNAATPSPGITSGPVSGEEPTAKVGQWCAHVEQAL